MNFISVLGIILLNVIIVRLWGLNNSAKSHAQNVDC